MNIKQKRDNKNTTNEFRYFLESNFVEVNRLFLLVYANEDDASKRFKAKRYYLPKSIIKDFNVIINGKNIYVQAIDSDIKLYEKIKKLTRGQGDDYATICLFDYDYIRNQYRLKAVDLSRQKKLDTDPKQLNK